MEKYIVKLQLDSETIFSGGESVLTVADVEVLYDDYKIPYYKAKSLKGNVREVAENFVDALFKEDEEYKDILNKLFGSKFNKVYKDEQLNASIKFSDVKFSDAISEILKEQINNGELDSNEFLDAITEIRYFNRINDKTGVTEEGSLRNVRVLNKDLIFTSEITSENELNDKELFVLCIGVNGIKHLGSLRSRGKGLISCTLLDKNNKVIDIEKLSEKVM